MRPEPEPPAGDVARVLIVDDEPAHVEAIRRALGSPGERWSCAHEGSLRDYREAAAAPDIVLLDLNLPDGNAFKALASARGPDGFPILVMTSFGNEQTAVDCLKAGALDYVVKSPEAFAAMPRTLQRALREWRLVRDQALAEVEIRRLNADLERRVAERTTQFEAATASWRRSPTRSRTTCGRRCARSTASPAFSRRNTPPRSTRRGAGCSRSCAGTSGTWTG